MPGPQDGAALLAKIKPRLAEDWYEVSLRPDLQAAFEEAYSDYLESKTADAQRTGTVGAGAVSPETVRRKKKAERIRQQIIDASVRFVFRGLPRDEFRALCDEHPPRDGNQYDVYMGYDRQAVSDALVRTCLVDPVFDDASWAELLTIIGAGQWDKLREKAESVNGAVVQAPPKALLA